MTTEIHYYIFEVKISSLFTELESLVKVVTVSHVTQPLSAKKKRTKQEIRAKKADARGSLGGSTKMVFE